MAHGRLHTHYDNLMVARNAPSEVIRAAYRVLAQRHHPDVNRSPEAERIMKVINEAYAVLSDPMRRAEHDAWIDEQLRMESRQKKSAGAERQESSRHAAQPGAADRPPNSPPPSATSASPMGAKHWTSTEFGIWTLVGGAFAVWLWAGGLPPATAPRGQPASYSTPSTTQPSHSDYIARLSALLRSNTVYRIPNEVQGNPKAVFEVGVASDCSIASVRLRRSSGVPGWDLAAQRGIERTSPLPPQADGTCPSEMEIVRGMRNIP